MLTALLHLTGAALFGQAPFLQLNLRYNLALTRYEVYALPSATQNVFNWGPSQISIVAPASVPNAAFTVTLVAGGAWQDNSQIYAPSIDPAHDFHGVGSLGAITPLVQGVEKLIFHFTLPEGMCIPGLRLFINGTDPDSSAPGMFGGDFGNTVFAIVPGIPAGYETYTGNYSNGGTSCSALPLEMTGFQAVSGTESIDLFWQTENELNFDRFELERSTDQLGFITLGRHAHQTGTSIHHYNYSDEDVTPGVTYYYRLKMLDYDGWAAYSDLKQARIEKKGYEIVRVSPNPASEKAVILFHSPEENVITMTLHDVSGRQMETQTLLPREGDNEFILDIKRYHPGVYWLTLTSNTSQAKTRIVRSE